MKLTNRQRKKKSRDRKIKAAINVTRNNVPPRLRGKARFYLLYKAHDGIRKAPGKEFYTRGEYLRYVEEVDVIRKADDQDIFEGWIYDRQKDQVILIIPAHEKGSRTHSKDNIAGQLPEVKIEGKLEGGP